MSARRGLKLAFIALVVVVVAIQVVPYGHDHTNPPVIKEPAWDSAETSRLVHAACFDCHSNETKWPFYANVAPGSWLMMSDVEGGRRHMNFSEWNRSSRPPTPRPRWCVRARCRSGNTHSHTRRRASVRRIARSSRPDCRRASRKNSPRASQRATLTSGWSSMQLCDLPVWP